MHGPLLTPTFVGDQRGNSTLGNTSPHLQEQPLVSTTITSQIASISVWCLGPSVWFLLRILYKNMGSYHQKLCLLLTNFIPSSASKKVRRVTPQRVYSHFVVWFFFLCFFWHFSKRSRSALENKLQVQSSSNSAWPIIRTFAEIWLPHSQMDTINLNGEYPLSTSNKYNYVIAQVLINRSTEWASKPRSIHCSFPSHSSWLYTIACQCPVFIL